MLNAQSGMPQLAIKQKNFDAILEAARRTMLEDGFSSLRMDVVAARAEVSRQTIYRAFRTKDNLIASVFESLVLRALPDRIHSAITGMSFREACVTGTILSLNILRNDPTIMSAYREDGARWFQQNMLDPNSDLHIKLRNATLEIWGGAMNQARQSGEFNPEISNEEAAEWIVVMHHILLARYDISEQEVSAATKKFLVPPLLSR